MTRMLRSFSLALAFVLALTGLASALTVRVTDRDLQGLLGYGESSGSKITVQLASAAPGPVTVFLIDGGRVVSYPAVLRDGQILLDNPAGQTLGRLLAARGFTLSIVISDAKLKNFSLPGLQDAGPGGTQGKDPKGKDKNCPPTSNGNGCR